MLEKPLGSGDERCGKQSIGIRFACCLRPGQALATMFGDLASEARENIRHDALCSFTGWSVAEFAEARIGFNKCAAIGVGVETSVAGDTSAGLTTLPSYAALASEWQ
jgi:hypothetical protein